MLLFLSSMKLKLDRLLFFFLALSKIIVDVRGLLALQPVGRAQGEGEVNTPRKELKIIMNY